MRIIPAQGETKEIDVAAAVVAADAKECKGKFISGRNSELVDSDVVFRGVATCEGRHVILVPMQARATRTTPISLCVAHDDRNDAPLNKVDEVE